MTIAACVPYLTIKIAWLSGSTIGWNDTSAAQESALYVGNAITMGMDAVAVLVALAFTFRWGRRIPAWLVLTPIWVAVGLLAPIVLAVPLGSLLQVLFSAEPLTGGDQAALQGWVFGAVYGASPCRGSACSRRSSCMHATGGRTSSPSAPRTSQEARPTRYRFS